ncbi:efflux RND transporter permease subunit, partial [Acinetobacter baumannii]
RMFHPMALTVVLALLGAMILSVTFVPAAVALFIGKKVSEKENRLMLWAKRRYAPLLDLALRRTPLVLAGATLFVALCGVI